MGRKSRHIPPFDVHLVRLGKGGVGVGTAPDGAPIKVRFGPPGSTIHVVPQGKRKGQWTGRRVHMVRKPEAWVEPPCAAFRLCGGCGLQELHIDAQRPLREALAHEQMGDLPGAEVHPMRAGSPAYGYRNRIELSFGPRRYVSEEDKAAGADLEGSWLGFHAAGRYDRIADVDRCHLVSDRLNAVLTALRAHTLRPEAPAPWNPHTQEGFWRHVALRESWATGEVLVDLGTGLGPAEEVEALAMVLLSLELPGGGRVAGLRHYENAGPGDVARGTTLREWGSQRVEERLGDTRLLLGHTSFFQSSTEGAVVLYETVREALGQPGGTLLDLYCGIGSIGLYLASGYERLVGVEEVGPAVEDARVNAGLNGVKADFRVGKVEAALDVLGLADGAAVVVDPPRAGLHPSVAHALARCKARVIVYVACNPLSLERDAAFLAEGGWRASDVWTVDLFPQTGHVEAVARFVRG